MTAEMREPVMGLTFEKVWAMFQESDRRMRESNEETNRKIRESSEETERKMRESSKETERKMRESSEETDRKMRESNEETNRKIKEVLQEIAQVHKETEQLIKENALQQKKTDEQMGKLGNRFGELAEHLVAPNIVEKFNALDYHFSDISIGRRKIILDDVSGRKIAEFDILLENKESIIGVEVKARPSGQDAEDHAQRLEILRRQRDKIGDKRKIHGALAGAIMSDSVKTAILKAGMYVITQTGDTMQIETPEGFIPKAW
jgi:flagellar biosynthesis GTPase FlhF